MMIYDEHSSVWNDTRERHEYECSDFLKSIESRYVDRLPLKARAIFATLNEQERVAFRICYSLARLSSKLNFFLSTRELQLRMGLAAPMTASRLLKKLEKKEVIKEIKKGSIAGAQASSYRWLVQGKFKEKSPPLGLKTIRSIEPLRARCSSFRDMDSNEPTSELRRQHR